MLLALEVAAETVCAEHLQRAEEHEKAQAVDEVAQRGHLGVLLQSVVVFGYELAAQLVAIACRCLPEERGEVIVVRTASTALEVDELRIAVGIEHNVACLEVAVEERVDILRRKILGEEAEVCLELQFVEVEPRRFQEAILEVVEVEEHAVLVELGLRIAVLPVESACSAYLYVRQLAYCGFQQLLLALVVSAACLATATYCVEKRRRSEVALQVAQSVVALCEYVRHWQLALLEVLGEIDKGVVLVAACAYDADNGRAVLSREAVVLTVAACSGELLGADGFRPTPFCI